MNKIGKNILLPVGLVVVGLVLGWFMFSGSGTVTSGHTHETQADEYTCSMHPQVRENEPGTCPLCGMDLVPISSIATDEGFVRLTDANLRTGGIQTTMVTSGNATKTLVLQGKLVTDESRMEAVASHFNGRVERLFTDVTGEYIQAGQKLATLYSPDLITAQKELFEAVKFKDTNPSYYNSALQKLKLWELTDDQIESILSQGEPMYNFDLVAPRSGTILERKVSEGEHVMDGQVLFHIADLSHLWAEFQVYEADFGFVKVGDELNFSIPSLPGKEFNSKIAFIDPVLDTKTRTITIRADVANTKNDLKPEMFAEGRLKAKPSQFEASLLVPKSAVLWTGKRSIVYVESKDQPNTFENREIVLGPETGNNYVILEGLEEGESIVTNGVFKVDAAAQLQGKSSMMNPSESSRQGSGIPEEFQKSIKTVYDLYLPLKDALIDSDAEKAAGYAPELLSVIKDISGEDLEAKERDIWLNHRSKLIDALEGIIKNSDLEEIRTQLSPLSDQLYNVISYFDVSTGGYRQYCPMAFNNTGAYWISDSDEVLNPYFGDRMLRCGNVEEEL